MTIRIENLFKTYALPNGASYPVLEDITFTIEEGDFVMILGESGCGKSTFLNVLAGLLPISSGTIRVNGADIEGPHPSRSIIFQQPSLLPWLNVEENIVFGCEIREETQNLSRVNQLIRIMGLSGFEKTYPPELSVGMAQRVCLARALIGNPEILLLDEPFTSLDTFSRTHLQEELMDFWQIENFTAVFVTHDIDEAILMGNKVVLLGGRPCRIIEHFDIDLKYPRDISHSAFFEIRTTILRKFKDILVGKDSW